MGLFDRLKGADINQGVEEYKNTEGAVLLDVRGGDEYASGHIPGSINIALPFLSMKVEDEIPDHDTPIFTYCLSGARSANATAILNQMGYTNVVNIGGIGGYRGPKE